MNGWSSKSSGGVREMEKRGKRTRKPGLTAHTPSNLLLRPCARLDWALAHLDPWGREKLSSHWRDGRSSCMLVDPKVARAPPDVQVRSSSKGSFVLLQAHRYSPGSRCQRSHLLNQVPISRRRGGPAVGIKVLRQTEYGSARDRAIRPRCLLVLRPRCFRGTSQRSR